MNGQYLDFEKPIVELELQIQNIERTAEEGKLDLTEEIQLLHARCNELKKEIFSKITPWQRVQLARLPNRPDTTDYIDGFVEGFIELHGDRNFSDDKAIISGLGKIDGQTVMVIGHRKGKDTKERVKCNFGSAHPEGYRKALEKMKIAEIYDCPVVTFINTPGAYPGIGAEERGQAYAIAKNLCEMSLLTVPIICVVIGEGGSGGALGIGLGDRILIMENAYLSVISPEGCAAILWRDSTKSQEAAVSLKLSPKDLLELGIVDEIVPEPLGGAHRDYNIAIKTLKNHIVKNIKELKSHSIQDILEKRYEKYRKIGKWFEEENQQLNTSSQKIDGQNSA